jgi:hypothetical protein
MLVQMAEQDDQAMAGSMFHFFAVEIASKHNTFYKTIIF